MSTQFRTETYKEGPGCGLATGRDGCVMNGEHPQGLLMFIRLRRSMVYKHWFMWDADANDGDGYAMHADGSIYGVDDLALAARVAWDTASALPVKRGDFHRTGTKILDL
jgi:hypothetical protein